MSKVFVAANSRFESIVCGKFGSGVGCGRVIVHKANVLLFTASASVFVRYGDCMNTLVAFDDVYCSYPRCGSRLGRLEARDHRFADLGEVRSVLFEPLMQHGGDSIDGKEPVRVFHMVMREPKYGFTDWRPSAAAMGLPMDVVPARDVVNNRESVDTVCAVTPVLRRMSRLGPLSVDVDSNNVNEDMNASGTTFSKLRVRSFAAESRFGERSSTPNDANVDWYSSPSVSPVQFVASPRGEVSAARRSDSVVAVPVSPLPVDKLISACVMPDACEPGPSGVHPLPNTRCRLDFSSSPKDLSRKAAVLSRVFGWQRNLFPSVMRKRRAISRRPSIEVLPFNSVFSIRNILKRGSSSSTDSLAEPLPGEELPKFRE